jgi:hydrogenase/urease accessory protein HupE
VVGGTVMAMKSGQVRASARQFSMVNLFASIIIYFGLLPMASAHPMDLGYLQVHVSGHSLNVSLQMNAIAAHKFAAQGKDVFASTLGESEWLRGESQGVCNWRDHFITEDLNDPSGQLEVKAVAECESLNGSIKIYLPFLQEAPSTYRVLGRIDGGDVQRTFILDPKQRDITIEIKAKTGFFEFVHLGIAHIGALPSEWFGPNGFHWPDGIDHILFVLALILGGGSAKSLIKTISGFTVGHSVTLGLSALNLVHFPVKMVESLIALSIVYVAIEALLLRKARHRWRVAAIFGLFHGFGFASALNNLELSRHNIVEAVIGFNSGVEVGQIIIILAIAPLIYLIKLRPEAQSNILIRFGAACIAGCGSYWFVERLFS